MIRCAVAGRKKYVRDGGKWWQLTELRALATDGKNSDGKWRQGDRCEGCEVTSSVSEIDWRYTYS